MKAYPDIQFVVVDFRGINDQLRRFLDQMEHVKYASDFCRSTFGGLDLLVLWRNRIAEWFLEKTDRQFLCCFDSDARPHKRTLEMLDHQADVVGCNFFSRDGGPGHEAAGDISMAAYKVSRRALLAMERPWYKFVFNDKHTKLDMCECLWFCQQARAAGIYPIKSGLIIHGVEVGLVPTDKPGDDCRMRFLHQIEDVTLHV